MTNLMSILNKKNKINKTLINNNNKMLIKMMTKIKMKIRTMIKMMIKIKIKIKMTNKIPINNNRKNNQKISHHKMEKNYQLSILYTRSHNNSNLHLY